jgi:hypothetical protein
MPNELAEWFRTSDPRSPWTLDVNVPDEKFQHRIRRDQVPMGTAAEATTAVCSVDVRAPDGGVERLYLAKADRRWRFDPQPMPAAAGVQRDLKEDDETKARRLAAAEDAARSYLLAIFDIVMAANGSAQDVLDAYRARMTLDQVRQRMCGRSLEGSGL